MTAPSPKEALELKPCPFCNGEAESDSQRHYRNISTGNLEKSAAIYCTKCSADMTWCYRDTPEIEREQVMVILTEQWNTRATLQPSGERREAIARALAEKWPGDYMQGDDECEREPNAPAYETADAAILASGLVRDEAGIRAEEREVAAQAALARIRKVRDGYANQAKFAYVDPACYFREFVRRLDEAVSPKSAIRSARDGGASWG